MGLLPDTWTELREIDGYRRRRDQADRIAQGMVRNGQVANLGKILNWFPWMPDGVSIGLAQSGFDAESEQTDAVAQQVATDQANSVFGYGQQGDRIRAKAMTQQQLEAARSSVENVSRAMRLQRQLKQQAAGGGVFGDAATQALSSPDAFQQRMALEQRPSGGFLGRVAAVNDVVNPAKAITGSLGAAGAEAEGGIGPEWLRDNPVVDTAQAAIDSGVGSAAGSALKATTRTVTAAMDAPRQIVQGQYRTSMQNIREKGVLRGAAESFIANPQQAHAV